MWALYSRTNVPVQPSVHEILMRKRSDTAERIVREAMRLFADKGYERTSIADIQKAAGLHPGSGALYKHFPSKEAVLQAGLDQFVESAGQARALIAETPGPAPDVLMRLGGAALAMLENDRDLLRIVWRELDAFPAMRDMARDERMQLTFAAVAEWLRRKQELGEVHVDDPDAAAVVILGSVTMFRMFEIQLGARPLEVSDDRFLRAWHALMTRGMVTAAES